MHETPMLRLNHPFVDLHAKLEFTNLSGSSKDRAAFWILKKAAERGEITEASTVVESSSGNFAIAMAAMCRVLGLDFVPVIDPNCNSATEAFLRNACPRVEKVTERDETGGFLKTRLLRVQELREAIRDSYWPDQYGNLDATSAHYHLTGTELCRALPRLDYVFVGTGTGGTVSGISRKVKEEFPEAKVIGVDTAGSAIFGQEPAARLIPGIGSSIRAPLFDHAHIDDVVIVDEADAITACRRLLRHHGLFAGGSTGSVFHAIDRYFDSPPEQPPVVAFLCADRGIAYADTVYDDTWVREHFGDRVELLTVEPVRIQEVTA